MYHCHGCGTSAADEAEYLREGWYKLVYDETDYYFCDDCWNDTSEPCVFTDYLGVTVPRSRMDTSIYYDGDCRDYRSREREYQCPGEPEHSFLCSVCDDLFYGHGHRTTDTDEHVCGGCADTECFNTYDEVTEVRRYSTYNDDGLTMEEARENTVMPSVETSNGFQLFRGTESRRFLAEPLVGIEFEHGPVQRKGQPTRCEDLYKAIIGSHDHNDRFTCHSDSTVAQRSDYASLEIVSSPASGEKLEGIIDAFYAPFASGDFTPGPEHKTCGFHVHVESRFLQIIRRGHQQSDIPVSVKIMAAELLNAINAICSGFISSNRRKNRYCQDSPSVRPKNMDKTGAYVMEYVYGSRAYPSIAIRTLGTVEFRLWPSSNSISNTRARVELSQKLVSYYDRCIINDTGELKVNNKACKLLKNIADMCCTEHRKNIPDALKDLLALSDTTHGTLTKMSQRFNPFSHHKTVFQFTDKQIAAMKDEDSLASTDYVTSEGFWKVSVGDTTIEGNKPDGSTQDYIAHGGMPACFPAEVDGEQQALIQAYAKGEL